MNDTFKELLKLNDLDWDQVLEGLDALKSRGVTGELMGMMFESILMKEPEANATVEEKMRWQKRQEEKIVEKAKKEKEEKELKHTVDILKAKIILIREAVKNEDLKVNGKKLN